MLYIQIFAILVFIIFSPVRNRELENSEYRKYKILSLIILIGIITFSYISHYANILTYVIPRKRTRSFKENEKNLVVVVHKLFV